MPQAWQEATHFSLNSKGWIQFINLNDLQFPMDVVHIYIQESNSQITSCDGSEVDYVYSEGIWLLVQA